jgi:hypothetical protein
MFARVRIWKGVVTMRVWSVGMLFAMLCGRNYAVGYLLLAICCVLLAVCYAVGYQTHIAFTTLPATNCGQLSRTQ